jgi:hypothetical protein
MNGCDYAYRIGMTTPAGNKEGTYGVTTSITCPKDKSIVMHMYKAGSVNHPAGDAICTITIGEKAGATHTGATVNQGLAGAHLTHTVGVADDIDLTGVFSGIHEEHFGTLCGATEAEEATSNATQLVIDLTIKGHNAEGGNTPVTITDTA